MPKRQIEQRGQNKRQIIMKLDAWQGAEVLSVKLKDENTAEKEKIMTK